MGSLLYMICGVVTANWYKLVVVLCTLEEIVRLMENEISLVEFLKAKVQGSIIDKQPFSKVL